MAKHEGILNGTHHKKSNGSAHRDPVDERPAKKAKLLDDSDDSESDDGGVSLKVNEEFAKRFEHNKKREEKQRLEEKYGKGKTFNDDEDDEDSEEDVSEDDAGEFATEDLDAQISATLQAIRSKDPRVYDKSTKFFREEDAASQDGSNASKKGQSMTLRQYHTKNLLEGRNDSDEEEDEAPKTHAQEQEETRQQLIKELQAADDDEEDDFMVAKSKPQKSKQKRVKITEEDIENADKDPETFLSNFMAARAWVPTGESHWQPLESDDEEEEEAAETYESAYNMYFENPEGANERLVTYARDTVANTSVRRDDKNGRRKAREAARAKREVERLEREEELQRLRKYKIEDIEEKVKKIRKTAGLTGRDFKMEDWADVLEADWSDDQWDQEMKNRFGDSYYQAGNDVEASESEEEAESASNTRKKPKKPKWDDDIDIADLVSDFEDKEDDKPAFTLSDEEENAEDGAEMDIDDSEEAKPKAKSSKQRKKERLDAKSSARRDRRLIENLVDSNLEYEKALAANPKAPAVFRYRETSPTDFGMTPRDILLASDKQLNEFAGLKKLAAFRDPAKKKKDKKHLSKKARLRQWRVETFGDAEGPKGGFEVLLGDEAGVDGVAAAPNANDGVDIRESGSRSTRRKKKNKKRNADAVEV
ncbi:KRI1-like family C-terminal-domain-containing protein [Lophiotrema nucula]|uniref:KRI1-like family C-terminal-domain-containing protein n=1 Tax=Lophiotrema nucula TaxID=690887 RepID=A0A6A5ZI70_9PLEO|nr:KRI1-like family C-terminal-domain-containing protein [Lophiotrema nucula]